MKFAAIILTFLVLTLSVLPDGCAAENPSKHTSIKENHKSQQNDDDCCGHCSPFYTCGSCIGFITTNHIIFIPLPAENPVQLYKAEPVPAISKIACTIWQPPKLS